MILMGFKSSKVNFGYQQNIILDSLYQYDTQVVFSFESRS